jgi:UDP:flavonoid glycosyltransferase YjiC (YdhE family)
VRVLFASTRGAGHFTPLVPLAAACAERGHDVTFAGPPELAEPVAQAGFSFEPFADPPADELGEVWAPVPSLPPDEQNAVVVGEIFGRLNTAAALPGLTETCARRRPDVVVRDPSQFAAAIAAELAGVPHARVAVGLAATEAWSVGLAAARVDEARAAAGLPADPEGRKLLDTPYLTAFPASLENPAATPPRATHRFRDPAWHAEPGPDADRWAPRHDHDVPLVYVTFGSVAGGMPMTRPAYAAAIEAVADLPVRVLLTVGRAGDEAVSGTLPRNVTVERWVPQGDVLAHADAVVHHGGSGSTLGSLAAGVPGVIVPLFADQPANAERVEASGAGFVAPPDAGAIHTLLGRVLADPACAEAAQRIAAELRDHPPVDAAVDALEALA